MTLDVQTARLPLLDPASAFDLIRALPDATAARARHIHAWLGAAPRETATLTELWERFCGLLLEAGVPVARGSLVVETLHAAYLATADIWTPETGAEERRFQPETQRVNSDTYTRSPFYEAHQTRKPVELWLPTTDDSRFGIVHELKAQGFTHYLCCPMFFANGNENGFTLATRAETGFAPDELRLIALLAPSLEAAVEISAGRQRLDDVLKTYLGDDPHCRVLSGQIRRGEMTEVTASMLFADMRDSTRLTENMTPSEAADLFNGFFDCIVPPIEKLGGVVLKYMGDGLLAIFRDGEGGPRAAAEAALAAAEEALACLDAANGRGAFLEGVAAGIALHHGLVSYGNIGSGTRLDFTVVGRDVNLASRASRLNRRTGERLLMTGAFAPLLSRPTELVGRFEAAGLSEPIPVHRTVS